MATLNILKDIFYDSINEVNGSLKNTQKAVLEPLFHSMFEIYELELNSDEVTPIELNGLVVPLALNNYWELVVSDSSKIFKSLVADKFYQKKGKRIEFVKRFKYFLKLIKYFTFRIFFDQRQIVVGPNLLNVEDFLDYSYTQNPLLSHNMVDKRMREKLVCIIRGKLKEKGMPPNVANFVYLIPVSCLENHQTYVWLSKKLFGISRDLIAAQGFLSDELFIIAASQLKQYGGSVVAVQHGGGYYHRQTPHLSEILEKKNSTSRVSWVQNEDSRVSIIRFPNTLKLHVKKSRLEESVRRIVYLSSYEGSEKSVAEKKCAPQTEDEILLYKRQIELSLALLRKKFVNLKLIYRPTPGTPGYLKDAFVNEYEISIDKGREPLSRVISMGDLFIIDNLNTTFYQLLDLGIPFIAYIDRNLYPNNEIFKNSVISLVETGILCLDMAQFSASIDSILNEGLAGFWSTRASALSEAQSHIFRIEK
jgi:hypothetical protein